MNIFVQKQTKMEKKSPDLPLWQRLEARRRVKQDPELGLVGTAANHELISCPASITLASNLSRVLACPTPKHAAAFITSSACSRKQRRALAVLAGLTAEWVDSDQAISENVTDLAGKLVTELYEPYQFLRSPPGASGGSHRKGNARLQMHLQGEDPRTLFGVQMATRPLLNTKGFWEARNGLHKQEWLPPLYPDRSNHATFDAVVHFVQAGMQGFIKNTDVNTYGSLCMT